MRERVYLYDAIASNRRRIALGTFVFFAVIFVEALIVSALATWGRTPGWKHFLAAMAVASGATLFLLPLLALWAYYRGKQTILKLFWTPLPSRYEIEKLRSALEGVCSAAGVEEPEIQVIATSGVNAVSLARGYKEGLILVTRGAVENLDRGELEALLAHEVHHIISHDTWMWILGLGISALLPLIASAFLCGLNMAMDEDKLIYTEFYMRYVIIASFVFVITWISLAVIWIPLWVAYFTLVLPGNRDYLADAEALLLIRNPQALISAIEKADIMRSDPVRWGALFINHMFFHQPLEPPRTFTRFITDLLNTHPPAEERVSRIRSML